MAHRAHLLKNDEVLFEYNNAIPFFWFCLLDADSLNNAAPDMVRIFDDEESEETANIKLPKKTFMHNLTQRKQYIAKIYCKHKAGDIESLYDSFVKYLNEIFDDSEALEIDVLEIANFDDMPTLIRNINVMLLAIDAGEPTNNNPFARYDSADSFVGWDGFYGNKFKEYSSVYADVVDKFEKKAGRQIETINTAKVRSDGLMKKPVYYAVLIALIVVLTAIGMLFQLNYKYWIFSAGVPVLYIWCRDVLMKK